MFVRAFLFLLLGFLTLTLSSCSGDGSKKKIPFLENPNISTSRKIALLLQHGHPKLPLDPKERKQLYNFYKANSFNTFFVDSTQSTIYNRWSTTIQKAEHFGLPLNRIKFDKKSPELIAEVMMTYQIGASTFDLDHGFTRLDTALFKPMHWEKFPTTWVQSGVNTDSIFLSRGPADTSYRYFATHLFHYRDTVQLDSISYRVSDEKTDKTKAWNELKIALTGLGYINSDTDSLSIRTALKTYQTAQNLNADGRIGTSTIIALSSSKVERFHLAMLQLDRLRQQEPLPNTFIHVNIPSFSLRFVHTDTLRAIHRVIVGKANHQTPTLQSKLTHIVSMPYWKVPSSIAKNEILPALKRDAAYLQKQNMRIYKSKDQEVDPSTVNWKKIPNKTFPYQVIQDPGQKNSLGLIKFEFNNSFSVYIHDTPSRSLFNQKFRGFSHGCMRAAEPIELGKNILTLDKIGRKKNPVDADSLQVLIDEEEHQKIPLQRAIPVIVTYQTVVANRYGLFFYQDLYEKEKAYLKLFEPRNNG